MLYNVYINNLSEIDTYAGDKTLPIKIAGAVSSPNVRAALDNISGVGMAVGVVGLAANYFYFKK